jgi:Putative prokaryotic signal transducing protein
MRTIARFQQAEDAHLLRSLLGSRGVEAGVLDEHLIQIAWTYSDAIGGVRVVVADSQADEAVDVYREYLDALIECPRPVTVVRAWPMVLLMYCTLGVPALIFGRRVVSAERGKDANQTAGG